MRRFRYVVVDVFTDTPLAGNQLAVFTDARDLDELTMQALAKEMNFAETVFVLPPPSDEADVRIRIFTPALELPFAGHPTLGSAFVLGGPLPKIVIRLETGAGVVPVELEREGPRIVFGRMEQPIPSWEPVADPRRSWRRSESAGSELPVERYDLGPGHVYVELDSPARGRRARPRPRSARTCNRRRRQLLRARRAAVEDANVRARPRRHRGSRDRLRSRAARVHLARHGRIAFGEQIEISQGTEIGRPSTLYATADGEGDSIERVTVGGSAVIVARGEFSL